MRMIEKKQIAAIWASAKEYGLDKQNVYDIIGAVSEKEHMTGLTYLEAAKVIGKIKGYAEQSQKRTDAGGDPATVPLRKKIYALTKELGWNDNNDRINGFCKKMFGVERIEWLQVWQCHSCIEALKKMVDRKGSGENATKEETTDQ